VWCNFSIWTVADVGLYKKPMLYQSNRMHDAVVSKIIAASHGSPCDSMASCFRKRFNQRRLLFLFAYSVSNWLAVSCFSFWKAFAKCPSLCINGIFDDVRYDVISTYFVKMSQDTVYINALIIHPKSKILTHCSLTHVVVCYNKIVMNDMIL